MAKESLRAFLHRWARSAPNPNGVTATLELFVADFGEEYLGRKWPSRVALGEPKQCYTNAAELAMENGIYEYVEGYARNTKGRAFHFDHAWCVIGDRVVDPTLENAEDYEYLGVKVPTRQLISIITAQDHFGILTGSDYEKFIADWKKSHQPFEHGVGT